MENFGDPFVLPDGDLFDTNVGLDESPPPFRSYGKFLAETKSVLARYGLRPSKIDIVQSISAEVGDDEIEVSNNPVYPAAKIAVYGTFLGNKISESDTSINPRFGNYAEDLIIVPDGYEQTYHYSQRVSNFKDMSYIDVPKLRLAIDIRPGRMNHSATNDGKVGMLGSRLAWLPRDSPVRGIWEIFNLFQDINLCLIRDKKFAYLPTALGGYGKPVPFGNPRNFENFALRYKQGSHAGLARELVRRTNTRFSDYTITNRYQTDEVLSAVSRLQSSWHDWIKGKSLYAPTCWLEAPPEVAQYRTVQHGHDALVDSAVRRLQSSGHLVSENDLMVAYEHNLLCRSLLSKETYTEFKESREAARKEWQGLSTFSMRLYGLLKKIGVDTNLHSPMTEKEYRDFTANLRDRRLHLRSFLRQEWFYDKAAKDFVYKKGPMMVPIALYPHVTKQLRRHWVEPMSDYQGTHEAPEEFQSLMDWVKGDHSQKPPSMKLVEDDPFIIREVCAKQGALGFMIVTDDIRLCRTAYMRSRHWIIRVPVKWYYMSIYYGDGTYPWEESPKMQYPMFEWETILDQGSIDSFEETNFRDGSLLVNTPIRPFSLLKVAFKDNKRIRSRATAPIPVEDPGYYPEGYPSKYLFAPNNYIGRRKHPRSAGWA
jgi:hypothetical protein